MVVILLGIACAVQGIVIYKQFKTDSNAHYLDSFEKFSSSIQDMFERNRKERDTLFDHFFDEDFFSTGKDPFKEMERLHKQLEEQMHKKHKGTFTDSWSSWFGERFLGGSDDIELDEEEKNDAYVFTLKIPNLKKNKIDIKISADGILITGEFSQIAERKNTEGNITAKKEIHKSISKNIPIPSNADHKRATVENKKDNIVITMPKSDT
jgi:HSP20 family molecular chaperone IbpA